MVDFVLCVKSLKKVSSGQKRVNDQSFILVIQLISYHPIEQSIQTTTIAKKQNKMVGEALDYIDLIIDGNIPLLSCNKSKIRIIVNRGYTGSSNRKLCTKTFQLSVISNLFTNLSIYKSYF